MIKRKPEHQRLHDQLTKEGWAEVKRLKASGELKGVWSVSDEKKWVQDYVAKKKAALSKQVGNGGFGQMNGNETIIQVTQVSPIGREGSAGPGCESGLDSPVVSTGAEAMQGGALAAPMNLRGEEFASSTPASAPTSKVDAALEKGNERYGEMLKNLASETTQTVTDVARAILSYRPPIGSDGQLVSHELLIQLSEALEATPTACSECRGIGELIDGLPHDGGTGLKIPCPKCRPPSAKARAVMLLCDLGLAAEPERVELVEAALSQSPTDKSLDIDMFVSSTPKVLSLEAIREAGKKYQDEFGHTLQMTAFVAGAQWALSRTPAVTSPGGKDE